jgi:HEPN domain-containing protein
LTWHVLKTRGFFNVLSKTRSGVIVGMPRSMDSRLYYRAALQRFEDAEFLLEGNRTTGAVYLAGYSVECILKALILSGVPEKRNAEMVALISGKSGQGARPHDFEWLKWQYEDLPRRRGVLGEISKEFARVNSWSTAMRYMPGTAPHRDAREFLRAAKRIIDWASGRL